MALDLSDPELVAAVARVRSDVDPATYCVFGYEGKAKIICKNIGEGSCYAAMGEMNDSEVSYALLRVTGTRDQESKTVKFIFVMYVGPNVGGMARGRAGGHKPSIIQLIGQSHVSVQADDLDDITEEKLVDKLKKASGANYDLGSNASGYETKAGNIGKSAAAKYKALEKESNIGPVVFNAKSHVVDKNNVTAMDLGGRPMVAPPTEGKKNVVVRDEAARAPGGSSSTVAARKEFERVKAIEDAAKAKAKAEADAKAAAQAEVDEKAKAEAAAAKAKVEAEAAAARAEDAAKATAATAATATTATTAAALEAATAAQQQVGGGGRQSSSKKQQRNRDRKLRKKRLDAEMEAAASAAARRAALDNAAKAPLQCISAATAQAAPCRRPTPPDDIKVGMELEVFFHGTDRYHCGTVYEVGRETDGLVAVRFDDGDDKRLDLSTGCELWRRWSADGRQATCFGVLKAEPPRAEEEGALARLRALEAEARLAAEKGARLKADALAREAMLQSIAARRSLDVGLGRIDIVAPDMRCGEAYVMPSGIVLVARSGLGFTSVTHKWQRFVTEHIPTRHTSATSDLWKLFTLSYDRRGVRPSHHTSCPPPPPLATPAPPVACTPLICATPLCSSL
jgi:hypothetical protein